MPVPEPVPQLSVVIPAFNAGETIVRVLEALLASEGISPEIVVVDDGSTDDTPQVAGAYGERVRLIRQPASGGPSRPRTTLRTRTWKWLGRMQ